MISEELKEGMGKIKLSPQVPFPTSPETYMDNAIAELAGLRMKALIDKRLNEKERAILLKNFDGWLEDMKVYRKYLETSVTVETCVSIRRGSSVLRSCLKEAAERLEHLK